MWLSYLIGRIWSFLIEAMVILVVATMVTFMFGSSSHPFESFLFSVIAVGVFFVANK